MSLFSPVSLAGRTLQNRIVLAPMTRSRADPAGVPLSYVAEYYRQRAGAGLIITEGVQPSPMGQGYPLTPGIHSAEQIAAWAKITDAVHEVGGVIVMQIMHVGRIAHAFNRSISDAPVSASTRTAGGSIFTLRGMQRLPPPRALTTAEARAIIAEFGVAAANAFAAGVDGVELHAANGYLPAQFLSPGVNDRHDEYGGPPSARARFALQCLDKMIEAASDAAKVGIRISPGVTLNDVEDPDPLTSHKPLLEECARLGIGYVHIQRPFEDALNGLPDVDTVRFARELFPGTVIATGNYDAVSGAATVQAGTADLIGFGRPFIANPDFPERLRLGAALAEPDPATIYAPGPHGYIDYPPLKLND